MVKESSGDIQRMHRLYELSEGTIPLYGSPALEAFVAGSVDGVRQPMIPDRANHLALWSTYKEIFDAQQIFYQQLPLLKFILKGGLPTTTQSRLEAFRR